MKAKQYHYILFDLDGTLTDPGEGITNSVAHALAYYGIQNEDRSLLNKFIGPPLAESFAEFYGFSEERIAEATEYFREYFRDKGIFENEIYEGIEDVLKELLANGKELIVATSKPEEFAKRILEHFHIIQYFTFVAGSTMDEKRVKKDEVIRYALESCGIEDMSQAIMIGDRRHDIIGAKKVEMDSIGVLYGYGDEEELTGAGATYLAETVQDIVKLLCE